MEYVKVACFTKNSCKLISVAEDKVHLYKRMKSAVVNPNLDRVKGIEPEFWKHRHGTILPLSTDERVARWADICDNGLDNTVPEPSDEMAALPGLIVGPHLKVKWYVKAHWKEMLIYTGLGFALNYLIR